MALYVVKPGDSPFSIALRFTGNGARLTELVAVNPKKPRVMVGNTMTFSSLAVGETLNLPASWGAVGVSGTLGAFSGGGAYNTVCVPVPMPIEQARQALEQVIQANPTICSKAAGGIAGHYPRDQSICDFQAAYDAAPGFPPLPIDATLNSNLDAELGPNTLTALNTYLTSINAGYSWACNGGMMVWSGNVGPTPLPGGSTVTTEVQLNAAYMALLADTALCGTGTISTNVLASVTNFQKAYNGYPGAVPIAVTGVFDTPTFNALNLIQSVAGYKPFAFACSGGYLAYTGGTTPPNQLPSNNTSSTTTIMLGGLALLAAGGAFYLLHKHQGQHAPAIHAAPSSRRATTHRLSAHRRR